ncbi:MAG TPA: YkvA family protein [Aestuariivirgaceae bacterium]|jgi:uncharacterized membrane protein YkvA (DUF1232 family)|nr:YkvA family protein [Aestuariivirgaceae bacterium]
MSDFSVERAVMPGTMASNERIVRRSFWQKVARTFSYLPFASNLLAAWYCAFDPGTPLKVRGILLAALAYFVIPLDIVPDLILGLGFTDDMTVLITAVSLIQRHMKPEHYDKARETIARLQAGTFTAPSQ